MSAVRKQQDFSFSQAATGNFINPLDGAAESQLYHDPERWGFTSILQAINPKQKKQSSFTLAELPDHIRTVDPKRDAWIAQNEFTRPNRRAASLCRLTMLFADLDTYKEGWAFPPRQMANIIRGFFDRERLVQPSLIIYSGRGYQLKWLFSSPIPARALPRWNLCQLYLGSRLSHYGADAQARDASRVLRIPGTINSKSQDYCRVVDTWGDGNDIARYDFEYLCQQMLPVARSVAEREHQEWDAAKRERKRLKKENEKRYAERGRQLQLIRGELQAGLRQLSARQLSWDRRLDLEELRKIRGGVQEGQRMLHLFWELNFLAIGGKIHRDNLMAEAAALANEIDSNWQFEQSDLCTLRDRIVQFGEGKKIEYQGREYPPLYTPKSQTLIDLFQITTDEQDKLRTIISPDLSKERHKNRQAERRRAAGAMEREAYLTQAAARKEAARAAKAQGLSIRKIAEKLGVSAAAVSGYLKA